MSRAEKRRQQKKAAKAAKQAKPGQGANSPPSQQTPTIQKSMDLALQHHTAGRLPEAEGIYQQILQVDPDHPVAMHFLGVIAHQMGKNDVAVDLITQAIGLKPDYAEAHNNLGNVLWELGRHEDAVVCCRKAIALNPDFAEAYNNLGNAFHKLDRPDDAVASYEKSLAIEQDSEVYLNLGSVYQRLDRLDDAVACYEKSLAIEPDFAEAHYNLGTALEGLGKFESAFDHYETAGTSSARAKALGCLYALGRYDELYQILKKFAEADKTDILIASTSVFVSNQLGRENPHPFCKNPLDFIRVGTIANSTQEIDDLVGEVLEDLKDTKAMWEPPRVSTISGYQTPANLFADPKGSLARLEGIIKTEIDAYHSEFKSKKCVFTEIWPTELRLKGWLVNLYEGGHQDDHIHPGGWLSGVLYLKMPETYEGDEGCIEFNLEGFDYPLLRDDSPTVRYRPEKGQIVLFPSSLIHRTIPIGTDEERMSLAFDLFPASTG